MKQMNIFDMNPSFLDDMATDYLNGMYESQYDEDFTEEELQNQKAIKKIFKEE